jgi:hypothetical protein
VGKRKKEKRKKKKEKRKKKKGKMPAKVESEATMLCAVLSAFLFLIAMYMLFGAKRRRILAVMSPNCAYCRRSYADIDATRKRGEFDIVDAAEVEGDAELHAELRSVGYKGSVPFFYNRGCGKTVTGYKPTSALLAALR